MNQPLLIHILILLVMLRPSLKKGANESFAVTKYFRDSIEPIETIKEEDQVDIDLVGITLA